MGPLDKYNEEGDIVWNHGSAENYDGIANITEQKKVDPTLVIDLNGTEFNLDNLEDYTIESSGPGWNKAKDGNGRNFKAQKKSHDLPYKTSLEKYQKEFEDDLAEGATLGQSELLDSERQLN